VDDPVREAAAPPPAAPEKRRKAWPTSWLVLPALALTLIIFAYPVLKMFQLSVTEFTDPESGLFANYTWFFTDPTQVTILRRTFLVSAWVTLFCLLLGFPYAYLMTLVGRRTRLLMLAAVLLPFWSNLVVRTYAWVILLRDTGPVKAFLEAMGIDSPRLIGNMIGVTIGATQVLLPFLVLPLYASLSNIDRRLLTAAESLGASPRRAFVKIYLPLALPGILAGSLIVFVLMLGFYFTPALLGSPSNSLISQQIVTQVSRLLEFGRGGAMALILLVITLVLLGLGALLTRRSTKALGIGEER
jgi:putative spermidine/putrescine transport system permease protein